MSGPYASSSSKQTDLEQQPRHPQKDKGKGKAKQQVSASSFLSLKADLAELRSSSFSSGNAGSTAASLDSLRKPERVRLVDLRLCSERQLI